MSDNIINSSGRKLAQKHTVTFSFSNFIPLVDAPGKNFQIWTHIPIWHAHPVIDNGAYSISEQVNLKNVKQIPSDD
jgi:hypothetical protein